MGGMSFLITGTVFSLTGNTNKCNRFPLLKSVIVSINDTFHRCYSKYIFIKTFFL